MNLTEQKLSQAIEEVNEGAESYANCQKLMTFEVLKRIYYPGDKTETVKQVNETIGNYGDSEFLRLVAGQPTKDVMLIINELMDAVRAFNPKLYINTLNRL